MAELEQTPKRSARKRCAIYTRKSSEEGLERAFNSLDAQREACAAYILSQKHEGWTVYPVHVMTRKSFGLITRKLSVTESQRSGQFRGTISRRKLSVASAN